MISYGKQDIQQQDIDAVVEVLHSDWLTQGPKVPEFESALADYCKVDHAVACNSATSALHIACLALGVTKGDTVWTSPISFVASANCALYCGANIDFVDVDPATGLMSVEALQEKLKSAASINKLPKVIIPVHLCGHSCNMEAIAALVKDYNISIIEDASHSVGGSYKSNKIGSCDYSDVVIFSFHPVKIITSAEGGMALTKDDIIAEKMRDYRSHGVTNKAERLNNTDEGSWYYEQHGLGYNYRMTELQAALGLSQLSRLDKLVSKRNQIVKRYNQSISAMGLPYISPSEDCYSAYHLYVVFCKSKQHRLDSFNYLRTNQVQAHVHYIPIHTQPYYRAMGFQESDFPNAMRYYNHCLTIPLHPNLSEADQDKILRLLGEC